VICESSNSFAPKITPTANAPETSKNTIAAEIASSRWSTHHSLVHALILANDMARDFIAIWELNSCDSIFCLTVLSFLEFCSSMFYVFPASWRIDTSIYSVSILSKPNGLIFWPLSCIIILTYYKASINKIQIPNNPQFSKFKTVWNLAFVI